MLGSELTPHGMGTNETFGFKMIGFAQPGLEEKPARYRYRLISLNSNRQTLNAINEVRTQVFLWA